jgi:hypothetical protein
MEVKKSNQDIENIENIYTSENKKIIDICFITIYGCNFNEFMSNKIATYYDINRKNKELEKEITEIRDNYWKIHQILIKNGLN